jgi:3D (Asp-Asp-Asp) domain-containing protein
MNIARIGKNSILSLNLAKKLVGTLVFIICFEMLLFPAPLIAEETGILANDWGNIATVNIEPAVEDVFVSSLPTAADLDIKWSGYYSMTAYNSLAGQTDSTPCITANGFDLCKHGIEDSIAANFLKFGTKVRIPELFGDRIFVVRDRMNRRYTSRVDIWMKSYENARDFGLKYAKIEVLKDAP